MPGRAGVRVQLTLERSNMHVDLKGASPDCCQQQLGLQAVQAWHLIIVLGSDKRRVQAVSFWEQMSTLHRRGNPT